MSPFASGKKVRPQDSPRPLLQRDLEAGAFVSNPGRRISHCALLDSVPVRYTPLAISRTDVSIRLHRRSGRLLIEFRRGYVSSGSRCRDSDAAKSPECVEETNRVVVAERSMMHESVWERSQLISDRNRRRFAEG
jgi:hypothetical protein